MNITLRPHVGHKEDGTEVRFAQDEIYWDNLRVGYVGHEPGAALNIIRTTVAQNQEAMAAIEAAVAEKFGAAPGKISVAPSLTDEEQLDAADGLRRAA